MCVVAVINSKDLDMYLVIWSVRKQSERIKIGQNFILVHELL